MNKSCFIVFSGLTLAALEFSAWAGISDPRVLEMRAKFEKEVKLASPQIRIKKGDYHCKHFLAHGKTQREEKSLIRVKNTDRRIGDRFNLDLGSEELSFYQLHHEKLLSALRVGYTKKAETRSVRFFLVASSQLAGFIIETAVPAESLDEKRLEEFHLSLGATNEAKPLRVVSYSECAFDDPEEITEFFVPTPAEERAWPIGWVNQLPGKKNDDRPMFSSKGPVLEPAKARVLSRDAKALLEAAEKGNAEALFVVGHCHLKGEEGFEEDFEKAVFYYRKAAALGHPDAEYRLGLAYEIGLGGLEKDLSLAIHWLQQAVNHGHGKAAEDLFRAVSRLNTLKETRTVQLSVQPGGLLAQTEFQDSESEYSEDEEDPVATYIDQVKNYDSETLLLTAFQFMEIPGRKILGIALYRHLAEQDNPKAQFFLAQALSQGDGVVRDIRKATEWCVKSSMQAHDYQDQARILLEDLTARQEAESKVQSDSKRAKLK